MRSSKYHWLFLPFLVLLLAGCGDSWNNPYPATDTGAGTLYTVFEERPKHLDPARSYSSNEVEFTGQIYEPPLQYHFLKRPYALEPLTTSAMPVVRYWDASGNELSSSAAPENIARTTYDINIRPGIRYQPHPAFAKYADGTFRYVPLQNNAIDAINTLADFAETGTRELVAADYVYEIKRLANPRLNSPIIRLNERIHSGSGWFEQAAGCGC